MCALEGAGVLATGASPGGIGGVRRRGGGDGWRGQLVQGGLSPTVAMPRDSSEVRGLLI